MLTIMLAMHVYWAPALTLSHQHKSCPYHAASKNFAICCLRGFLLALLLGACFPHADQWDHNWALIPLLLALRR